MHCCFLIASRPPLPTRCEQSLSVCVQVAFTSPDYALTTLEADVSKATSTLEIYTYQINNDGNGCMVLRPVESSKRIKPPGPRLNLNRSLRLTSGEAPTRFLMEMPVCLDCVPSTNQRRKNYNIIMFSSGISVTILVSPQVFSENDQADSFRCYNKLISAGQ